MPHWLVLLLATITWLLWVPAAGLEKLARGEPGTISLFPVFQVYPLAAWGLAYLFHRLSLPIGATMLGVVHALLLAIFIASIVRSFLKLRQGRKS